ncbi:tRNA (adenosine(37)-N6)-threonylcarbamoyltransferase complex ATPase subunit type 1 TsaE [Cecembia lonarensis]|uniref:tRNA (adenosine(37)-N6)-threonylcarbamoyltransferase complex ATPase subunit type 1 TsaE n=1 Tax=Cecembia lonarensis TaxID=645110 RepID=UPI00058B33E6|nr:tRNA (adenosine(37)-N6)-threonylcarbamoyltransferase complex ATPase subunit type 1 TsaE [Cecembia lonarensis]
MKIIRCENLAQLDQVAEKVIQFCKRDKVWVFKGQMGAGKTTLIKSISKKYGIDDVVSSPTFSIVNEYRNAQDEIFYHFDFYRIEKPEEVLEIGIEEYFYSGRVCWIEWAEKIPDYIPLDFVHIKIEIEENGARNIVLQRVINGEIHG